MSASNTTHRHITTAAEMIALRQSRPTFSLGCGLGSRRLARAIAMSKPVVSQAFFDANLRQWQLTIAHIADAFSEVRGTSFNRKQFYKECNK